MNRRLHAYQKKRSRCAYISFKAETNESGDSISTLRQDIWHFAIILYVPDRISEKEKKYESIPLHNQCVLQIE